MTAWEKKYPMGTLVGDPIPGAPQLAARGGTVTGVRTVSFTDPGQADVLAGLGQAVLPRYDRPLQAEIWYPALPGREEERAVYTDHMGRVDLGSLRPFSIQGRAFRDAAPDEAAGPCPVVVISHGYPGSRYLLANLAENLSTKGYVVISIGHTDNTYEDFPKAGSLESALIHRSLDQRFVISQIPAMNEAGFLRGMIQPEKIALIGFSMGGYGALRTVGGRLNEKTLAQMGPYAAEAAEAADFRGMKAVQAAAFFAPATFFLAPERTEDIDIPTMWFCGTADHTVHYDQVRQYCLGAARSDRYLISYEGCGHNVANNPAPPEAYGESWEIFKRWSDPVWDTVRLNNANCHFLTAFLDLHLRGHAAKAEWLRTPVIRGAEAVYSDDPAKHTGWKGFLEGTAAGICLEHFAAER